MNKTIIISMLLTCFLGNASENKFSKNQYLLEKVTVSDTLLINIQTKIIDAFVVAVNTKKVTGILTLQERLESLYKIKKQNLILYWQSYSHFFLSLFYTINQNKKQAEKTIDKGIDILENIKNKTSEDYALLGNMQNFSTQFKGMMKVIFISKKVKENGNKAIELDSTNLRAYYVLGSNDFFTPKMFGGGKKAEELFKKAISLPNQKIKNPYLPSWGKDDAYIYLIHLYIKEERWEEAKKYYQICKKLYPNRESSLKQIDKELENK